MVMHNPFLKRFREFILAPSHSRTIGAVVILIIAAAIPLTVLVAQKQQEVRQHAATYVCSSTNCTGPSACVASGPTTCELYTTACRNNVCTYGPHTTCTGCSHPATPTPAPGSTPTPAPTTPPAGTCKAGTGSSLSSCGGHASYVCAGCKTCEEYTYRCVNNNNQCSAGPHAPVAASNCAGGCTSASLCATPTPTPAGCTTNACCNAGYASLCYFYNGTSCQAYAGTNCSSPAPSTSPTPTPIAGDTCTGLGAPGVYECTTATNCATNFIKVTSAQCPTVSTSTGPANQICCMSNSTGAVPPPSSDQANSFTRILGPANQCVVFTTFSWAPVSGAAHYEIRYIQAGTTLTYGPYVTGPAGTTSTSITTPFAAGTTNNGFGHIQCPNANQNQTGYSCGFGDSKNITWYVASIDSSGAVGAWSAPQTYTTASCAAPTPTPTPPPTPDCNATPQTTSACVATTSNTCSANNGTQTAQYTTYNGSTVCNPVNITQTCTVSSCNVGNICTNGTCIAQATPTPTPNPSGSPTPTPTPIPGHTMLAFTIGMDAIGSAGDNENPNPSSSNQSPQHTTRNLAVQIFDSNNSQVFAQVGSINYNSGSGVFLGTVDLGANFANGNYTVKVKSDGHLRRLIPGIQNITSALTQPIQMLRVNLVAGDVDLNNALNINDYNILLSCVSSPFIANIDNHVLCNSNANYIQLSDLEDNGVINEFDYNLFLREYAVQNGD